MLRTAIQVIVVCVVLLTAPANAQTASDHAAHHPGPPATAPRSDGEVRKIDRSAGKITIKHGELRNLDMPAMTMVFRAKDPAVLDRLEVGDKIRFTTEKVDGVYTVLDLEVVK